MNKKFLSAILFGALVASTGSFVSCADNDAEIKQLQDQNSDLKAQLAALKTELQAELKSAASASQVAAIEAKLSAIESATADNLQATVDALNGKFDTQEAKFVAINTQLKALEGLQGVDAKELISALEKAKENGGGDINSLSAMVDALDAQINTMIGKLCGLVFQPEFYIDGIEAAEYTYLRLIPLAGDADKYTNAKTVSKYDENWNYIGSEPGQYNEDANPVQIYDEKFVWGYAHWGNIAEPVLGTYENRSSIIGSGEGYSAKDKDGNMRGVEVYGDGIVNKMTFAMNPSTAKPGPEDLAFISKNVAAYTRANAVDINIVDAKPEGGYLTVYYTIADAQIKNIITANNTEKYLNGSNYGKENTTIVKLQANNDTEEAVESDWAAIYETAIQPVAVAINAKAVSAGWYAPFGWCDKWNYDDKGNATTPISGMELDKNPYEALARYDNTFSLMWNDEKGVDLADYLDIHMVKHDVERTGDKLDGYYTNSHSHISLAEAQEMYGLTVEFKMVPYTADGNKTRPSNYLTLTETTSKGHVVANIVDEKTGEAKTGVQGVSSVGKQPLVQVLVKHGDDVVLDAYIRILIDRALEFKTLPEPIDLGTKAYDCSGKISFGDQWFQTSTLLYEWIGMSRNEFHNAYYMDSWYGYNEQDDQYGYAEYPTWRYLANQYKSDLASTLNFNTSRINVENQFARIVEYRDNEKNTNATVSVELDPAAQRYVWEQEGHTATINVVYRPNGANELSGVNTGNAYIIVPLKITIDAPATALTWVEKDPNYWYAADGLGEDGLESIRMNVNEPTDNGSTVPFVSYVKNTLMGNTVKFMSGDKEFQFANKATAKSKFYFHPFTNGVVVENEYTKEKYYLSVKNNWVECNIWDKTTIGTQEDKYPYTSVTKEHVNTGNAKDGWSAGQNLFTAEETQAVEAKHMLDANKGIYTNTELFAHTKYVDHNDEDKIKDNDPVLIATIDADGKIVYENNPTAKAVLNATSHKNPTAMAYVGVIATDQCNETTLPVANNVFPVYFLRPLDIDKNDVDINVDANDNGAEFTLFDKVAFTDWRDQPFVKGQDPKYTNIWYMAYYNVNTITIDFNQVTTTLGNGELGKTLLKDVSSAVKFYFMDGTTVKADNLSATAEPAMGSIEKDWAKSALNKASMGVESTYDTFVKHFGTIKYSNNNSTVKTFQVRIPVTFGYDWGEVTTEIDVTLKNTMGN